MIKFNISVILIVFFSSFNLNATNIVVINIEKIINENKTYIESIKEIEINQNKYLDNFKNLENKLEDFLEEIENSKLILEDSEINNMIAEYNNNLNEFSTLVDKFNNHYNSEVVKIRNIILEELIILIEKYVKNNNVDIVLDSNNYLIASNAINITTEIANELNKINLNLDFVDFEKN